MDLLTKDHKTWDLSFDFEVSTLNFVFGHLNLDTVMAVSGFTMRWDCAHWWHVESGLLICRSKTWETGNLKDHNNRSSLSCRVMMICIQGSRDWAYLTPLSLLCPICKLRSTRKIRVLWAALQTCTITTCIQYITHVSHPCDHAGRLLTLNPHLDLAPYISSLSRLCLHIWRRSKPFTDISKDRK